MHRFKFLNDNGEKWFYCWNSRQLKHSHRCMCRELYTSLRLCYACNVCFVSPSCNYACADRVVYWYLSENCPEKLLLSIHKLPAPSRWIRKRLCGIVCLTADMSTLVNSSCTLLKQGFTGQSDVVNMALCLCEKISHCTVHIWADASFVIQERNKQISPASPALPC